MNSHTKHLEELREKGIMNRTELMKAIDYAFELRKNKKLEPLRFEIKEIVNIFLEELADAVHDIDSVLKHGDIRKPYTELREEWREKGYDDDQR